MTKNYLEHGKLPRFCGISMTTLFLSLSACSSNTRSDPPEPGWIHQPARTVDAGYIVYVSSAEDRLLERAILNAKGAAIEDIANECSFAPKGTRLEDQYEGRSGSLHHVFVKMALSFQDCETAQNSIDPESIHKLANLALAEELKRYQNQVDLESQGEHTLASATQNTTPDGTQDNLATSPTTPASSQSPQVEYFVMRQQVAYAKEVVIFAPPTAYPAGSVQSTQFINTVQPATVQVRQYGVSHPELAHSNQSWSTLPVQPAVPALQGVQGMRSTVPRRPSAHSFGGNAAGYRNQGANHRYQVRPMGGRRRRGRWNR